MRIVSYRSGESGRAGVETERGVVDAGELLGAEPLSVRELLAAGEWEARSEASFAQAARFDWERSAGILLDLLRELATTPRR